MKMYSGKSASGNVSEAVRGLSNPQLILFTVDADHFEACVNEIAKLFPSVPSIGCIGRSYDSSIQENGIAVTAFTDGVKVASGVLSDVSTMPARHIGRLVKDIELVKPGKENTAIIDFCTGNDAAMLTSIKGIVEKYNLQVMGATGDAGKVAADGVIYEDAMVYAVVRNEGGRVKTYKENIYEPKDNRQLIASKTDKAKYYLGELNGRSAKQVYMDLTGVAEKDIVNQTFQNPLGKMIGNDVCIVSLKDISGSGLI